jgi:GAF domain-containing protein/anti-sigma regulatory factor (Ser/Thr protein kinase)
VFSFDDLDLVVAEAVARHAAVALENASSFEREREATKRFRFLAHATDQLFAGSDPRSNFQSLMQALVGQFADWAILYVIDPSGAVRVSSVAYQDPAFSSVDELRGQHLFSEAGERRFRDIVARRRSSLRTDVSPEVLEEFIQPFLMPVVHELHPQSLLVVPLFASDVDYGALGVYLSDHNYTEADRELFEELGRRASIGLEHARSVGRERRLVQTLQEVILPSQLPNIQNVVLSTVYAPATTSDAPVGGDWYDAFEIGDGRFVLSIGDVTGRGLQASAIMGKLRHAINVIALYEPDPARILDVAERVVLQRYPDAIVTAFVALFDPHNQRIRYANAGHPYPQVRLWDGSVEPLVAEGMQIGLRSMASPSASRERSLDDVALLAFYTDGVTEATRDLEYGERLLRDAIATDAVLYVRAPAALIAASCLTDGPHGDDAALMILGFPRSIGWSFDAENAKAAQDARGAFVAQLRSEATAESDLGAAEVVFGELIGNVVRHAPGPIDIALEWSGSRSVLHVIDRGNGFAYEPRQRVDVMREDGRGLWLVARFGLQLSIEHLPHFGTHIRVELPVLRR